MSKRRIARPFIVAKIENIQAWQTIEGDTSVSGGPRNDLTEQVAAAIHVRGICLIAKVAAENTAVDPENSEADRAYQNARNEAISIASGLADPFYRDLAFHFVYALCILANDTAAAQRVFDRITTDQIRGKIQDGRPALFD